MIIAVIIIITAIGIANAAMLYSCCVLSSRIDAEIEKKMQNTKE